MKPALFLPFMSLALSLFLQAHLYGQAKEYKPEHPTAADAAPKSDIITQVLPDRRVVFRLKAPDVHQVSVLVGPCRTRPSKPLLDAATRLPLPN
jgi:hypothetical protein